MTTLELVPFGKPLRDLGAADIHQLIEDKVPEGYRVEYKRAFQDRDRTAKSIASFANSSGGWYIVGVQADPHTNEAISIPGISLATERDPISKLRNFAKTSTSPVPPFELRLIEIGTDSYVLVAFIPEGDDTPYFNRDGRIYRRVADSSEPVPETDRHAIDRLIDRGQGTARMFDAFCNDPRVGSDASDSAWLCVYLKPALPEPGERPEGWAESQFMASVKSDFASLKEMFFDKDHRYGTAQIDFHTALLGYDSVILRHQPRGTSTAPTLELELFADGRCRFFIPILPRQPWSPSNIRLLRSSTTADALTRFNQEQPFFHELTFFDVRELWFLVALLGTSYESHLRRQFLLNADESIAFKWRMQLRGVSGYVAFADTDAWTSYVLQAGLPVIQHDVMTMPELHGRQRSLTATGDDPLWGQLAVKSFVALGLPVEVLESVAKAPTSTVVEDAHKDPH